MNRTLYIVGANIINIIQLCCEMHGLILAVVLLKFTGMKRKPNLIGETFLSLCFLVWCTGTLIFTEQCGRCRAWQGKGFQTCEKECQQKKAPTFLTWGFLISPSSCEVLQRELYGPPFADWQTEDKRCYNLPWDYISRMGKKIADMFRMPFY